MISKAKRRERTVGHYLTPEITLTCEPERMPIEGNASATGDLLTDTEVVYWITKELSRGNEWAWCIVKVEARITVDGETFIGMDYLGGCSYKSEDDFKQGGYYNDMISEATEDLRRSVSAAVKRGNVADSIREIRTVK